MVCPFNMSFIMRKCPDPKLWVSAHVFFEMGCVCGVGGDTGC